jgi:putative transposase
MDIKAVKYKRKSIRLKGYDYTQPGGYFITCVTQDRERLFGKVVNGEMQLNEAGQMVEKWWRALPNKFPSIRLGVYVVMPNHFHGIVVIEEPTEEDHNAGAVVVGADQRVYPKEGDDEDGGAHVGAPQLGIPQPGAPQLGIPQPGAPQPDAPKPDTPQPNTPKLDTRRPPVGLQQRPEAPLSQIIQWFKTMTTNAYIHGVKERHWPRFDKRLWQRNYYEHIIRDEAEWMRIHDYIEFNPARWTEDRENPAQAS